MKVVLSLEHFGEPLVMDPRDQKLLLSVSSSHIVFMCITGSIVVLLRIENPEKKSIWLNNLTLLMNKVYRTSLYFQKVSTLHDKQ
eukprot:snap_masked-scaffold_15-processed-gene-8.26-mRNA-1 protein AED:1.00 eAED:1.00 QI:0/0/0/0/1/1/2/0/84